jgi:hypothetical protein
MKFTSISTLSLFLLLLASCQSPKKHELVRAPSNDPVTESHAIAELQKVFELEPSEELRHKIGYSNMDGKVVIKIGVIKREQKSSMIAILKAVKNQQVDRIDGGMVVGAKTLMFLTSLRSVTAFKGFEIVGMYDLAGIYKDFQRESNQAVASNGSSNWTSREIIDFNNAIDALGLRNELQIAIDDPDYIGHFIRVKWTDSKKNIVHIGPWSEYQADLSAQ